MMSTTERPAPMVPAECTMGGNDWFPLSHRKLRKSKWWRRASDLARARNVMLWGEAYDATPAGSLPDDDDDLAEAAGFGMDVEAFIAVKGEIMAPWVLCSDGRWYHPTVCEVVLETWEKQSAKRRADAERKARSRARIRGGPEGVTDDAENVTRDADASHTGNRHTDRQTERTEEKPPTPLEGGGEEQAKPSRRKPSRPIPDGFPTEDVVAKMQQRCRDEGANVDAARQAEHFRNHALQKDRRCADWEAAFRNWIDIRIDDPKTPRLTLARPKEAPIASADDLWRQRVQLWIRAEHNWTEYEWGKPPRHPSTDVPDHILAEFGMERRQLRVVAEG